MASELRTLNSFLLRTTIGSFVVCVVCLAIAVSFALLGFTRAVASIRSVSVISAVSEGGAFTLLMISALVGAITAWIDRRSVRH